MNFSALRWMVTQMIVRHRTGILVATLSTCAQDYGLRDVPVSVR